MNRTYVCEKCVEDSALQEVVRAHAIYEECDYCGRKSKLPIAAEFSDVFERISFAVEQEYIDPAEELPYDGREGGYQGRVMDGFELLEEIGFDVRSELLRADVIRTLRDKLFCPIDYWPGPLHERNMTSWERFKEVVKHERRYTFWTVNEDPDLGAAETLPGEMLKEVGEAAHIADLITVLVPGTQFWRVRVHVCSRSLATASDFAAPPIQNAVYANRMSPAGIPMFYGAEDFATAEVETVDPTNAAGKSVTGGYFVNLIPLNILDLTAVPVQPSFFSDWPRQVRQAVRFLRAFAKDISQPVQKTGQVHIEYVPTQALTEYIRHQFKTKNNESVQGIKYPSSRNGRACYVLFFDHEACLRISGAQKPPALKFVPNSLQTKVLGP